MSRAASFERKFCEWLEKCLASEIPLEVRGFSFCVYDGELCSCIELNGTSEFSDSGREWTWSEIWQPMTHKLILPAAFGDCRKQRVSAIKRLLSEYLEHGILRDRLAARDGVALETLEGDYELIYAAPRAKMRKLPVRRRFRRAAFA